LGSSFGIATRVEAELAEKIVELMPSIEKIRFVSSGTEATMTAIRIARGFTGRPKIVKFVGQYHGHSDGLLVRAGSGVVSLQEATSKGVTAGTIADTVCIPFNDFEAVSSLFRRAGDQIAAVIVEPVSGNMGVVPPKPGFLAHLRAETAQHGTVLIFDEVITGFRVHLRGAQGLYGIDPDLTCLGKIVGGGFPAAAVGGKAKIMDCLAPVGPVYQAGTLSGNPLAMAAGIATLAELTPAVHDRIALRTARLVQGLREIAARHGVPFTADCAGSMWGFFFRAEPVRSFADAKTSDVERFRRFFHAALDRGVYLAPSAFEAAFMSDAHDDALIEETLNRLDDAMRHAG